MLPDGDCDLGVSDGSVVLCTNIIARAPFNLYAHNSTVRINNSEFGVGRYSGHGNRIVHPGNVTFQNCCFRIDGESDTDEERKWAAILFSCEPDSPMGRAHGGLYAEECDSY